MGGEQPGGKKPGGTKGGQKGGPHGVKRRGTPRKKECVEKRVGRTTVKTHPGQRDGA